MSPSSIMVNVMSMIMFKEKTGSWGTNFLATHCLKGLLLLYKFEFTLVKLTCKKIWYSIYKVHIEETSLILFGLATKRSKITNILRSFLFGHTQVLAITEKRRSKYILAINLENSCVYITYNFGWTNDWLHCLQIP